MSGGRHTQRPPSDANNPSSVVHFRVLDLRARPRIANGDPIWPYCVLRLGDRHHRTPTFPSEGLHVDARSTTADDRQLSGITAAVQ